MAADINKIVDATSSADGSGNYNGHSIHKKIWWIHAVPTNGVSDYSHGHGIRNARHANATTVDEWVEYVTSREG